MDKVIWKDVVGYEDHYKINNHGVIVSKKTGRRLNPWLTSQGYKQVQLVTPRKKFQVHRLIGMAFIPNPDNKPCINHINNKRADNRISNLEWVTVKENNCASRVTPRNQKRCPHCGELVYKTK